MEKYSTENHSSNPRLIHLKACLSSMISKNYYLYCEISRLKDEWVEREKRIGKIKEEIKVIG
jgi:hypothetical protein